MFVPDTTSVPKFVKIRFPAPLSTPVRVSVLAASTLMLLSAGFATIVNAKLRAEVKLAVICRKQ